MNTNTAADQVAILREAKCEYENGPTGMPRVARLPHAVIGCLIENSMFKYQANAYEGEDRDRLYGLIHDVAEEILARIPSWLDTERAATQPAGEAIYQIANDCIPSGWSDVDRNAYDMWNTTMYRKKRILYAAPAEPVQAVAADAPLQAGDRVTDGIFTSILSRNGATVYNARKAAGHPVRNLVSRAAPAPAPSAPAEAVSVREAALEEMQAAYKSVKHEVYSFGVSEYQQEQAVKKAWERMDAAIRALQGKPEAQAGEMGGAR